MEKKRKLELLAPAGNFESFQAAMANGADAVYMGTRRFNARKNAENFSDEEFLSAVKIAHRMDRSVYGVLNTLILDREWKAIEQEVNFLYRGGVDAIIVQDLGLAAAIRDSYPDLPLHASTQMTFHNEEGIKMAKKLGFQRIVVSREMELEQIKRAIRNTQMDLEVFAHGALCVSYSGQCLFSSMIGGRSGNRGGCAQPCRKKYTLLQQNGQEWKERGTSYVLSPKDLMTVDYLKELQMSGVSSLKLEGRMKRPEYVAQLVKLYRTCLDGVEEGFSVMNISQLKGELELIFNRGFTKGLLFSDFGKNYSDDERPDNRGLLLSEEVDSQGGQIHFITREKISLGEGITYFVGKEKKGTLLKKMFVNGVYVKEAQRGERVSLPIKESNVKKVYKTSAPILLEQIKESYRQLPKVPIEMILWAELDKPLKLEISCNGIKKQYESDFLMEAAQKSPLTIERLQEQMSKLGDTPYSISHMEIHMDESLFANMAAVNGFRRDAVAKFQKDQEIRYQRTEKDQSLELKENSKNILLCPENILFWKEKECSYEGAQYLYEKEDFQKQGYVYLDTIQTQEEIQGLEKWIKENKSDISGYVVGHFGGISLMEKEKPCVAGIGFNITNSKSVQALSRLGFSGVILSPEISEEQSIIISKNTKLKCYYYGYGFLRVMSMRHCPFSHLKGCFDETQCEGCNFRANVALKDERGFIFPVERKNHYSYLYNSVPHFILDRGETLYKNEIGLYMECRFIEDRDNLQRYQIEKEKPQSYTRGYFDRALTDGEDQV